MGGPAEVEPVLAVSPIHDLISPPPPPPAATATTTIGGGQEHRAVSTCQQGPGMVLSRGIHLPPRCVNAPVMPMETTFMDMEDNH